MSRALAVTCLAAALFVTAACGNTDEDPEAVVDPQPTQDAASANDAGDEYCPTLDAQLAAHASAYDRAIQAVNDAFQAEQEQAVAEAVDELTEDADALAEFFRDGAAEVTDDQFSAALQLAAEELDSHVTAVVELNVDDFGDPELTPDGIAFQEAVGQVLTFCD